MWWNIWKTMETSNQIMGIWTIQKIIYIKLSKLLSPMKMVDLNLINGETNTMGMWWWVHISQFVPSSTIFGEFEKEYMLFHHISPDHGLNTTFSPKRVGPKNQPGLYWTMIPSDADVSKLKAQSRKKHVHVKGTLANSSLILFLSDW